MSEGREVQERVVGRGMGKAREGRAQLENCGHLVLWVVSRKLQDILEDFWECLGKASHAYWAQGWPAWVALDTSCARPGAALGCTGVLGSSGISSGIL